MSKPFENIYHTLFPGDSTDYEENALQMFVWVNTPVVSWNQQYVLMLRTALRYTKYNGERLSLASYYLLERNIRN